MTAIDKLKKKVLDILYTMCDGSNCTHSYIVERCNEIVSMSSYSSVTPYVDEIVAKYELKWGTKTFVPGVTLSTQKSDNSWLYKKKEKLGEEGHQYEKRYRDFLLNRSRYGEQSVDYIMSEAEHILSYCANPDSTDDKKLGLVMGDVQSGKTSNYLALANMACDYGYNIVLILSGTTEALRVQTQRRIDRGLVGAVSSTIGGIPEYTGLGDEGAYYAIPLTTDEGDFKPMNCSPTDLNKPQILVAKKNKAVLEKIKSWLKPGMESISSKNILIIDDECDNASINTKKDDSPTIINKLIREIFNNFPCATYVGYTATPFANIFINSDESQDDFKELFPSDFIHRLKTTDELYFGIDKVFKGDDHFIEYLDPYEPYLLPASHHRYDPVIGIPESLKNAICTFLLCNCIRTLRGDGDQHRSMMINMSHYNTIQFEILHYVSEYVYRLKQTIPQYDRFSISRFTKNNEMERIYNLYSNSMFDLAREQGYDFEKVKMLLNEEIQQFNILVLNYSTSKDTNLDYGQYPEGTRLIVIGGFTLSRGLTLEGLMISYYNRNAGAYDTLLQMSRWFGYRPNYEDLCKIYMTEQNYDNFQAVVNAIDDLDKQLEFMRARGATPREYGLMIRQCPDILETTLLVTAKNKSKHSTSMELSLNFSGAVVDTPNLYTDLDIIQHNADMVTSLTKELYDNGYMLEEYNGRFMFRNVSPGIVASFINKLNVPPQNRKFIIENLSSFIDEAEYFKKWDIVFATGNRGDGGELYGIRDNQGNIIQSTYAVHRSFVLDSDNSIFTFFKGNNRLIDPGIFNSGLTKEQVEEAHRIASERSGNEHADPVSRDYLAVSGRNPLLVLLPIILKPDTSSKDSTPAPYKQEVIKKINDKGTILFGFGIGFAGRTEDKIMYSYLVNDTKLKEMFSNDDNDLEDDEDDESL